MTLEERRVYRQNWRKRNKDKCHQYTIKHYKKHKEEILDKAKIKRLDNLEESRLYNREKSKDRKGRYRTYRTGAKIRGIDFNLSFDYFLTFWNKPCHYCGSKINGIGLDRINNKKGYIVNNVVPCCIVCNKMKSIKTIKEFIKHCKKIINYYEKTIR